MSTNLNIIINNIIYITHISIQRFMNNMQNKNICISGKIHTDYCAFETLSRVNKCMIKCKNIVAIQ